MTFTRLVRKAVKEKENYTTQEAVYSVTYEIDRGLTHQERLDIWDDVKNQADIGLSPDPEGIFALAQEMSRRKKEVLNK